MIKLNTTLTRLTQDVFVVQDGLHNYMILINPFTGKAKQDKKAYDWNK
mgnify:CR=1 FL=1